MYKTIPYLVFQGLSLFTLAQLQTLKDNYAKGVFRVREADLTLDFADGADMLNRINRIEADLIQQGILQKTTSAPRLRTTIGRFNGGK